MDLKLKGKCAIVTGASRGVGSAVAKLLAAEGVAVIVNYHGSQAGADQTVQLIRQQGGQAVAIQADIGNEAECQRLFEESVQAFGRVDILINNAAVWYSNPIQDIPLAEWNRTMDVNLSSAFLLTKAFINRNMADAKGGTILNMTSQAAFNGSTTGHAHYAASKAGLVALTVSTAREVAQYGITVNAVALGLVHTDMIRSAVAANHDYYLKRIPMGRLAECTDIAKIVTFMVSDGASYMTGATIDATGGMLMR